MKSADVSIASRKDASLMMICFDCRMLIVRLARNCDAFEQKVFSLVRASWLYIFSSAKIILESLGSRVSTNHQQPPVAGFG